MTLVNINFKPDPKELHTFGKTMIIGFSIFALIALFIFDAPQVAFGLAVFGLVSFILSRCGKAAMVVYLPWMGFGFVMGTIVSNLILALLFYGLITPIGLFFKLTGRDILNRTIKKDIPTYWEDAPHRDNDGVTEYQKQF